jgi:hypothetical protein
MAGPGRPFVAMIFDDSWSLAEGPTDETERRRREPLLHNLVEEAGIVAGTRNRASPFDGWLNLLRDYFLDYFPDETRPYFHRLGWLDDVAKASATYCSALKSLALDLEDTAWRSDGHPQLRRSRYPVTGWLYTPDHEQFPDPRAEFDHWKDHVRQAYVANVDRIEKLGRTPWPEQGRALKNSIVWAVV